MHSAGDLKGSAQLRHCTVAQQGDCLQAEEEDAAALANEGQGAAAGTGLEASLHNMQIGNPGRVGPGAPPPIPSSDILDATGGLHCVFGANALGRASCMHMITWVPVRLTQTHSVAYTCLSNCDNHPWLNVAL